MLVSSWCRDGGATNISSVRAKPTPHSNTRTQSLTAGSSGQLPRPRLPPPWPLGQPTSPRPLVGTCATACHGLSRQSRPSGRHKARRCHSPVGVGAVLRCKADAVGVKGREAPPPLSRRMEMGWESCGGGGWGGVARPAGGSRVDRCTLAAAAEQWHRPVRILRCYIMIHPYMSYWATISYVGTQPVDDGITSGMM